MESGVSVIICCYNSEKRIPKVLDHLEIQKNTEDFKWEIIVVDNASSDNTSEVARRSWNSDKAGLDVVYEGKPGLSNARIKGIYSSKYPYIVFVDDDNWLSDEYISRAYRIMEEHPQMGLVGGLGIPVTENELPPWFNHYMDAYAVGPQADNEGEIATDRTYLHGAGLVMRREGWDYLMKNDFKFLLSGRKGKSMSSGEDSEISSAFRLSGYKLWYDPMMVFKHVIPDRRLSWIFLIKLAKEFGKSFVVLDMYITEIKEYHGWKRAKSHNWLIGTAICIFQLIKLLPAAFFLIFKNSSGNRKEFQWNYQIGILIQRFKLIGNFTTIRREIMDLRKRLGKRKKTCP